ncbi:hypothetical protein PLICRDRAFT_57651 [Plicaturopsis crispa FD-325 SS-3]|uniref:Uncharacterized protein n=1 Tax=Plicaturopsis crispa FD-325 SS-3 TaxID=944288 RepID=A0A0C9T4N6_PLICR|nr:hypothetical protein PLICRDRAFT_57651 [Plicaturopsis crispa FD-325 SS-3]
MDMDLESPSSSPPKTTRKSSESGTTSSPSRVSLGSNNSVEAETPSTSTEIVPKRAVSEVIADIFAPFDRKTDLIDPFQEEVARDEQVKEKLNEMLLDLLLECHAWSEARPKYQMEVLSEILEKEVASVLEIEQEQGKPQNISSFPCPSSANTSAFVLFTRTRR